MATKPIDRLLFAQGGLCFFCNRPLAGPNASIEHLVARTNGGPNGFENCVACCKALNALLGRMSLKEKLRVILNQKGSFKCPDGGTATTNGKASDNSVHATAAERLSRVVADLRRRSPALPGTVKTLKSTISSLFQKQLSGDEVELLLGQLAAKGVISVTGVRVSYELPPSNV